MHAGHSIQMSNHLKFLQWVRYQEILVQVISCKCHSKYSLQLVQGTNSLLPIFQCINSVDFWYVFDSYISDPSNPTEHFVAFFIVGKALPADMTVSVSANYMSASGKLKTYKVLKKENTEQKLSITKEFSICMICQPEIKMYEISVSSILSGLQRFILICLFIRCSKSCDRQGQTAC